MRQKLPLTFWRTGGIISIGSFPISHPLGPLCLQGGSFFVKKSDGAPPSLLFQVSNFSESALSSRTAP